MSARNPTDRIASTRRVARKKHAAIWRSFAAALLVVTSGCEVMDGMVGTSVPALAGNWQDSRGRAVVISQGGFVLEATMQDEAGKGDWTSASGLCSDRERLEMTFFLAGEKRETQQGVVRSNDQLEGQSIAWSDDTVWRRAPDTAEPARPKSQPHQQPDPEIQQRPRSQPHQRPDPTGKTGR